jgi:hypothetical protein
MQNMAALIDEARSAGCGFPAEVWSLRPLRRSSGTAVTGGW